MAKHPFSERPAINQKLHMLRKELGLTQDEAAKLMNMKYDTYAKKECYGKLTFEWVLEWARTLGVKPARFAEVFLEDDDVIATQKGPYETTPEKGKTFILNSPTSGIIDIYEKSQTKEKAKKEFLFDLSDTEFCLVNTFHDLTLAEQKIVIKCINQIRNGDS